MGLRINNGQHKCPVAGWTKVPDAFIPTLEWARKRINLVAAHQPNCDRYFIQLPAGITLTSQQLVPGFRSGDYAGGIRASLRELMAMARRKAIPPSYRPAGCR